MRNSRLFINRRWTVVVVVCVLSVGVGALAAGVFASGTNTIPATPPEAATPASGVDPALASAYAVLRRTPSASDVPPREDPGAMKEGANLQLARRVQETSGDDVYLAPSNTGACLLSSASREGGCYPTALLLSGNDVASIICAPTLPPSELEIYGLLPDSASNPRVALADGTTVPVTLTSNFYSYTASRIAPLPVAVEWEQGGSTQRVSANVPADAASERCATPGSTGVPLELHPGSPPVAEHD
jgi:hypothetical protein